MRSDLSIKQRLRLTQSQLDVHKETIKNYYLDPYNLSNTMSLNPANYQDPRHLNEVISDFFNSRTLRGDRVTFKSSKGVLYLTALHEDNHTTTIEIEDRHRDGETEEDFINYIDTQCMATARSTGRNYLGFHQE